MTHNAPMAYYRGRLARVHATDYTMYARAAARLLLTQPRGAVLDVGCGAGDLVELLEGWEYIGLDASPAMIALARQRYPHARFVQADARDLPDAQVTAVVAVGEVLNYVTDLPGFIAWLAIARERLQPGGVLLVDVAGPTRADPEPRTQTTQGDGYHLEVTVSTDPQRLTLTRTITVSDAEGSETETHILHLMDPVEVAAALRNAGFEVTALNGYSDDLPFPRGWSGFMARRIDS